MDSSTINEMNFKHSNVYVESSKASRSFYGQMREMSPEGGNYVETSRPSHQLSGVPDLPNRGGSTLSGIERVKSCSPDNKLSDWVIERMRQHESRNGGNPNFNYGIARP